MEKYDSEKTGNPGFEGYDWPMDCMDCGSLLPLSPASLLAPLCQALLHNHGNPKMPQQAARKKAAAGCRSPGPFRPG